MPKCRMGRKFRRDTIHRIIEGVRAKNLEETVLFVNFSQQLIPYPGKGGIYN